MQKLTYALAALVFLVLGSLVHAQDNEPAPERIDGAFVTASGAIDPSLPVDEIVLRLLPLSQSEIGEVADGWFKLLQGHMKEVVERKIALDDMDAEPAEEMRQKIAELSDKHTELNEKFQQVLSSWEAKGGDTEKIEEYRTFLFAVAIDALQTADTQTILSRIADWIFSWDRGLQLLLDLSIMVIAFFVMLMVAAIVKKQTKRWIGKVPNLSTLLQAFVIQIVYWVTIVVGLMLVLAFLGVNITPLFAVVGGASFIIGFALQETLGNLASGLLIMVTKPFDLGDLIQAAGVIGTVEETNIVSTKIRTLDNQVIVIPNNAIWGSIITNVNAMPTRRVDLVFGIGYEDDMEDAQKTIEQVVMSHPLVLKDPLPIIQVHELADSSVNIICWPWANTKDYWKVFWELIQQVKAAFDAKGISILFPQQDVHIHGLEGNTLITKQQT